LAAIHAGNLPAALPVASCATNKLLQWTAGYFPALQSRGGDGFSCECNRIAVARLPEHEVCGDCQGRKGPLVVIQFRGKIVAA
jgi:hypothetical protein